MNVQTHMSGQIPGQVPNQAGTQLPGLLQLNGNSFSNQIQNLGGHNNTLNMDPELAKARSLIQQQIYDFILRRHQQAHDIQPKKFLDIVRRLDEILLRDAVTKEEYMSLETLENRLHVLIKHLPMSNHNQHYVQHANSSSPIATMIPTPGMPHCGNSSTMVASSVDTSMIVASGGNSMVPVTCNTGSLLPTANGPSVGMHRGSLNSSDGLMSNGYQQALSNFSISSSGNNMVSSTVVQRMTSQMIPTPGFNSNNQSFMNLESSNDTGAFSTVESTMVSQPLQQKQHVGGQNSRILHNLGSHIGGGIRSGLQQKSYGYSNGTLNGGLGAVRNNLQFIDGPGSSEGYLATSSYGNSPKPLQKHYDQQQRPMMQGDGYGMSTPDSLGSGNFYAPVTSAGSAMNNQSLIPASVQSLSRATSPLMNNQSNLHSTQQVSLIKSQTIDPSAKMNFQASSLLRENLLQSRHQQQFQQQPLQLQQQQFVQNQLQQKQQIQQHQILFKNDSFGHSQVASDLGSQLKPEHGMECHDQALHSQVSEHLQFSELQNQFQHSSAEDHSRCTQLLSLPSIPENICSSLTQTSRQSQQLLHSHQLVVDSQNDFSCLSVGVRSERLLQGQWNPKSQDRSQIPGNFSHKQNIQEEFRQRITGQDEAQRNNLSTEGSICQTVVTTTAQPLTSVGATRRSANPNFRNQQRWLLFLRHARRCMAPEGKCQEVNCITVQKLWIHIDSCNVTQCLYPYCHQTKILLNHHKHCRDSGCPVCVPVKNFVQTQLKSRARSDCNSGLPCSIHGSCKSFDSGVIAARLTSKTSPPMVETFDVLQPSVKRVKTELHFQSLVPESENSSVSVPARGEPHVLVDAQHEDYQHGDIGMPMKLEVTKVKMEFTVSSGQGSPDISGMKKDNVDDTYRQKLVSEPIISDDPSGSAQQECIKNEKDIDQGKQENMTLHAENAAGGKSGKPKIKGVSLTELFTPEQIRQHIIGLRQWVGQMPANNKGKLGFLRWYLEELGEKIPSQTQSKQRLFDLKSAKERVSPVAGRYWLVRLGKAQPRNIMDDPNRIKNLQANDEGSRLH